MNHPSAPCSTEEDRSHHAAGKTPHLTALTPLSFWFLRHGQTDWNAQNLAQGSTDIPLNPAGIAQAHEAAELLTGRGITTIIASPLSRARVTAEIAGARLGLPVLFDPDLHEVGFGVMEATPMLSAWFDDWINGISTPDGGEPFAALRDRATAAINRALAHPAPVLVVAHGAVFRALRSVMGLDPHVRLANAIPQFCEPPRTGTTPWTISLAT